jgi:hypothetical protein
VASFWARWRSLLVVLAAVALVTAFRPYKRHPAIYADGVGYHLWTRAILDGDLSFRRYAGHEEVRGLRLADPARRVYQDKYPPGLALLRLPVMAPLTHRGTARPLVSHAEHEASRALAALALLLTCLLCLRTCRLLRIETGPGHVALLTTVFGTGLFHYGTYDGCMSHVYSALGGAVLAWLGAGAAARHAPLPPGPALVTCSLLVLIRNTNVLLLAGLAAAYLMGRRAAGARGWVGVGRDLLAPLAGAAAGVALQLAYNRYAAGHWALSSYPGEAFRWGRPMHLAVLFSYERGIFTYYPIVAVALLAGWAVRRTRPWAAWFALLLLGYAGLYGFWGCWTLGGSFGYRGVVEVMPAGAVLLAAALAGLSGWRRTAVSACAWVCMAVTVELMAGYWAWTLAGDGAMAGPYWEHVCGSRSLLGLLACLWR